MNRSHQGRLLFSHFPEVWLANNVSEDLCILTEWCIVQLYTLKRSTTPGPGALTSARLNSYFASHSVAAFVN